MYPKSPRNISGQDLIKVLSKYGYEVLGQKGSHIILSRSTADGTHHVTIPNHDPLRLGPFNAILSDVAEHLNISKGDIISKL